MKKKPSILFITMGINEGASRFRVQQYLPYLKKEGYQVLNFSLHWGKKRPEDYGILKYFWYLQIIILKCFSILLAPFYDIVFYQRCIARLISPYIEKITFLLNKNIIFDFDDAIWLNYNDTKKNPVAEVIKISKMIIAGNKILHDYANQFNNNITIIPTPVDTDLLKPIPKDNNNRRLRIGWTGVSANHVYLSKLRPVFKKLLEKYSGIVEFRILSTITPIELKGVPVDFYEWSPQNENKVIPSFDIGIMPLDDDKWARGKCAFKALQYMAAGVTVVASPVGMNKEVIKPNIGFLAESNEEWYDILCKLIDDHHLRNQFTKNAREEVEKYYSVKSNFNKFKAVIDSCIK